MSESVAAVPLREQQRAYTRSKLLESVRQMLVTRGFPDATVDDIVREAGASRVTFYLHFRSKTDVAAALVDEGTPFAVAQYRTLERYFAQMPEAERKHARDRALLLEIMTQRIFSLASTRELPVANDAILSTLLDMWYHTLVA